MLEAYGRFEPVVYDCQGINDSGSDVTVRVNPQSKDPQLICFQVKSFDDLTKPTYLQELKAQRDDSFRKVRGLLHYFIILCTDAVKHREKIRSVAAEFRSAERTEVIEPGYAYTFLNLPKTRIEALVTRVMEAEDYVFQLALRNLDVASPSAKALGVFMIVKFTLTGNIRFTSNQLLQEPLLRSIYKELRERQASLLDETQIEELSCEDAHDSDGNDPEDFWAEKPLQLADFEDQLTADIDLLENLIETDTVSDGLVLRNNEALALTALATDALVRYNYAEEELISYMFNLVGVRD